MNNDFSKNGVDQYGVDKGETDYISIFILLLIGLVVVFIFTH